MNFKSTIVRRVHWGVLETEKPYKNSPKTEKLH